MARWRLIRIRISGFRRFREPFVLDLRDPLGEPCETIVLAGSNGSGKTTVLEAIRLGLEADDALYAVDSSTSIELDLVDVSGEQTVHLVYAPGFMDQRSAEILGPTGKPTGRAFQPADCPAIYFSSRRAPAPSGSLMPSSGAESDSKFSGETHRIARFKQRVINNRARSAFRRGGRPEDRWLSRLNAAWAEFHGHDGTRIDADVVDPQSDDPTFDLFVFEADGQRRCSIDVVSSGEAELLAFAGTLVTEDFAGILLIDEPELHLHPEWASQIMRSLREIAPQAQIIAATHAAEPWDQAYPFERRLLGAPDDPRLLPAQADPRA